MIRQDFNRIDAKRRTTIHHGKKQFATPTYKEQEYKHRLNFYNVPPTADITLEQFEQWAIDRLRGMRCIASLPFKISNKADKTNPVLAELEACSFRNKTAAETDAHMKPILDKYLPLSTALNNPNQHAERQKDHYSHFILRLAFASTKDLQQRFSRVESMLFRLRFNSDGLSERQGFVQTLALDWETVGEEERVALGEELRAAGGGFPKRIEEETYFKVDWERVPGLVEDRRVFISGGKAYVPSREQASIVIAEFTRRLDQALEVCSLSRLGSILSLGLAAVDGD